MAVKPIVKQIVKSRPVFEGAFRVNNDDPQLFTLSGHVPQLAVLRMGDCSSAAAFRQIRLNSLFLQYRGEDLM